MKRTILSIGFVALVLAAARGEEGNPWEARLREKAESIVFVKFVLKIQVNMGGQTQDQERGMEITGTLVNDRGLVMTSNSHFDPSGNLPPGMRDRVQVKATPTDLKVLFGGEEEEYDAQLAAIDSVLGLAYVQILDLKDRKVTPFDLTPGPVPAVNEDLFGVGRLSREFDCAPALTRVYVRAKVEKPREMWLVSGEGLTPGLPAMNAAGAPVGVMALQRGSAGVEGGGGNRPFLLPLAAVAGSVKAAAEKAAELLAKPKDEEPKDEEPKPEEPAKPVDGGGEGK